MLAIFSFQTRSLFISAYSLKLSGLFMQGRMPFSYSNFKLSVGGSALF
jgi:hypothetical protein